ncbi:MAG: hypothetical protein IIZ92_24485 [Aquincola sp.]|nr:hypothetical protein [Aquincola sp.]|tara:strand:- start:186 stop:626 length:441 start_codon:yes stop_codon:yes gene_type:complete
MSNSNSARLTLDTNRTSAAFSFNRAMTAGWSDQSVKAQRLCGLFVAQSAHRSRVLVAQPHLATNGGQGITHPHSTLGLYGGGQDFAHLCLSAAAMLRRSYTQRTMHVVWQVLHGQDCHAHSLSLAVNDNILRLAHRQVTPATPPAR